MSAPCSVKTTGRWRILRLDAVANCDRILPSMFKVAICDLKAAHSAGLSWNAKSPGKRSTLRRYCSLSRLVGTPYVNAEGRMKNAEWCGMGKGAGNRLDRKSTRLNSSH